MDTKLEKLLALEEIRSLQQNWALWRDTGKWDLLRDTFTPDATIATTWFEGLATSFVEASIKTSNGRSRAQHFIGGSTIEINGNKALAETRVILLVRGFLEDIEVDATCYGRFYDRLVFSDGYWKIMNRTPIYEKDAIVSVDPGKSLTLDPVKLARYPEPYRHLAYLQGSGGATITQNIPLPHSPAQNSLYESGQKWLALT